jgi:hypothetical protein
MILNTFTCTGPYAIVILYGIKRTENRNMLPEPREGRAAILCSKSFCKENRQVVCRYSPKCGIRRI